MGDKWTGFDRLGGLRAPGSLRTWTLRIMCVYLLSVASAMAQVERPVHKSDSSERLLTTAEGRAIVNVAWLQEPSRAESGDCSHFVHQIYVNAGFEYPYASSFEIYAGDRNFERVKNPHPGDLIVWRGHVGIVVDPLQHSFYSLVRTGLQTQDYRSAYWRSRGWPRFYRYKLERGKFLNAARTSGSSRIPASHRPRPVRTSVEEQSAAESDPSDRPPSAVSERTEMVYDPPAPPASPASENLGAAFEIPESVIVATANRLPTREEVAEGISEVNDAMGSVLRGENLFKNQAPVEIVERFTVEKVDVKRGHGWARLAVDSKALIGGGEFKLKRRHQKVRWELRRTESGWEAVTPTDRTYVPQDVAVKNLAEQLARLTKSAGAAEHQPAVLQQESQLAGLLNGLLESKQDR
ncbi:MAG: CHAP domain-containing protein [Candidatus Acidiferrum sp.]